MSDSNPSEVTTDEPGELSVLETAILSTPALMLTDPDEVTADIAARIMAAESIDAVLAQQSTVAAEDVVGLPLELRSVKFLRSTFSEGPQVYAVVDAVSNDGTAHTITTGAGTVLAQLFRAYQLGAYPFGARFVKASKATAQGFFPMWIEPADPASDF